MRAPARAPQGAGERAAWPVLAPPGLGSRGPKAGLQGPLGPHTAAQKASCCPFTDPEAPQASQGAGLDPRARPLAFELLPEAQPRN